ncbi:MAG TPA: STAS domain-containing protein [Polyangium sp.]|nr:STAS domain-containing protein [Polyangium sp.]
MGDSGQAAEIEQLKARIAALEAQLVERDRENAALRAEAATLRGVIEQAPIGVYAIDTSGREIACSPETRKVLDGMPLQENAAEWLDRVGTFQADKVTPWPMEDLPIMRALRGETTRGAELFVRNASFPDGVWYETYAAPLHSKIDDSITGAVVSFIDCRQRKFLEEEANLQNKSLLASEADKLEIITRLRTAVEQLSTPILELWEDVLALPVIGIVDSRRSAEMMERLLHEIVQKQSRFVIIDLTGVEVIDTSTADHFMKLVKAVGLIGAQCVLTGIRPAVAQTLVDLDVSFGQLETLRNLRHGLRYCLRVLDGEGV